VTAKGPNSVDTAIRKAWEWAGVPFRRYVAHRIAQEAESSRDLEAWVRFVFDFRVVLGVRPFRFHFALSPYQRPSEILSLLRMVAAERPRRILEVGSAGGGTLFLFARAAASDAVLIGMDLPSMPAWRKRLYERAFGHPPQRVQIMLGDSHEEATAARVRRNLEGQTLDFLFIDADHSYEGVRRDFELYSPLVHAGGLIAFHDILPGSCACHGVRPGAASGGVPRFWAELKQRYEREHRALEIIEDPTQDGFGIGVLRP